MYLTFYLASDLDIAYLNNTVFLSRSYQVKFASRKFDVLKITIYPRSEATRAKMLLLRISHFHNVVASKQKQEKRLKRASSEEKRGKNGPKLIFDEVVMGWITYIWREAEPCPNNCYRSYQWSGIQ